MMRLILTTIILTMLAQPAWAETNEKSGLIENDFVGGEGLFCTGKAKQYGVQYALISNDKTKIGLATFEGDEVSFSRWSNIRVADDGWHYESDQTKKPELTFSEKTLLLWYGSLPYGCVPMTISEVQQYAEIKLDVIKRQRRAVKDYHSRSEVDTATTKNLTKAVAENLSAVLKSIVSNSSNQVKKLEKKNDIILFGDVNNLKNHLAKCWSPPKVENPKDRFVDVAINLDSDGSVIDATILDEERYAIDDDFRKAADAARVAVIECSPMPIPSEHLEKFKEFIFSFDLQFMGG
jgi:hypothetical protein